MHHHHVYMNKKYTLPEKESTTLYLTLYREVYAGLYSTRFVCGKWRLKENIVVCLYESRYVSLPEIFGDAWWLFWV